MSTATVSNVCCRPGAPMGAPGVRYKLARPWARLRQLNLRLGLALLREHQSAGGEECAVTYMSVYFGTAVKLSRACNSIKRTGAPMGAPAPGSSNSMYRCVECLSQAWCAHGRAGPVNCITSLRVHGRPALDVHMRCTGSMGVRKGHPHGNQI